MVIRLAYKLRGPCAAAITAALMGFNPFLIYCFIITKLFALTAFLIILSYSIWCSSKLSNLIRYSLSLMIMSLAVGVRISVLPAVVILFIIILIKEWQKKQIILFAALTVLGSLGIIFLPFYFWAPEQFLFNLIRYHSLRDSGSFINSVVDKFDSLTGLVRDYFFPLLSASIIIPIIFSPRQPGQYSRRDIMTLGGIILAVSSIHLISHNPLISDYLSIIFPLFALLIGICLTELTQRIRNEQISRGLLTSFFLGCFISLATPARSFVIPAIKVNPVKKIEELGEFIRNNTLAKDLVLTYNNAIATVATRNVIPGTEMNSIAFTDDWPDARCRKFKLLNQKMLLEYIRKKVPKVIVLSKLSLSRSFPGFIPVRPEEQESIFASITRYYHLERVYKNFGYSPQDETYVYIPKK
jgi:hypothetical protein